MYYIGVDVGSTYIKAVLTDLEAGRIEKRNSLRVPPRKRNRNHNYYEIPVREIVRAVRDQIDEFAGEYDGIRGILLATQMHGFVYSVKDRDELYVSWQDMRCLNRNSEGTATYLDTLAELLPDSELDQTGIHLKPSLGLCNLYTLLREEEVKRDGELYTLGSYIIKKLTGRNVCHITNGAPLGLVNIVTGQWEGSLIDRLGFSEMRFPRMAREDTEIVGFYKSGGQEIPVYPDYGDQQCSILGSMCGFEDAVINIATASQVSVTERKYPGAGAYEVRPFFAGTYLKTISNMPGGRNLDVLTSFIRKIVTEFAGTELEEAQIWEKIAKTGCTDAGGLSADMAFYPVPDRKTGGAICGITDSNLGIEEIFTAAFENMAQVYWKHVCLLKDAESIRRLVCAGGVSWKRPELIRMIREVSGKECVLSPVPDETLQGFYQIALVCEGICRSFDDLPRQILKAE